MMDPRVVAWNWLTRCMNFATRGSGTPRYGGCGRMSIAVIRRPLQLTALCVESRTATARIESRCTARRSVSSARESTSVVSTTMWAGATARVVSRVLSLATAGAMPRVVSRLMPRVVSRGARGARAAVSDGVGVG